jgi:hypothetical protein
MTATPRSHAHRDEGDDPAEPPLRDRPIDLVDIGQALGTSANLERLGDGALRAWRDDLTSIRESLTYARTVLAGDVAILSQSGSLGGTEPETVADEISRMLGAGAEEPQRPEPDEEEIFDRSFDDNLVFDEGLFLRADHLLAAHQEMARVNLSSAGAVARVRELVEGQLAILSEREAAVEARLQQIRAVIIRRYRIAVAPVHDQSA